MPNENLKTLEDKLSYAYDTKVAIKDAIEAKGVDIPDGTVFRDYATKIGEIQTGGGTAVVTVNGYSSIAATIFDVESRTGTTLETGNAYTVKVGSLIQNNSMTPIASVTGNAVRTTNYDIYVRGDCTITTRAGGSG